MIKPYTHKEPTRLEVTLPPQQRRADAIAAFVLEATEHFTDYPQDDVTYFATIDMESGEKFFITLVLSI